MYFPFIFPMLSPRRDRAGSARDDAFRQMPPSPYIYGHVWEIFVIFRTFLFARGWRRSATRCKIMPLTTRPINTTTHCRAPFFSIDGLSVAAGDRVKHHFLCGVENLCAAHCNKGNDRITYLVVVLFMVRHPRDSYIVPSLLSGHTGK